MQQEPSAPWHTASKMAVSYFKAVIIFNMCLIHFWLEYEAHRCRKRPPLSGTGDHPCPQRCNCFLSPEMGTLSMHLKMKFGSCHKHFACLIKENRCVATSCKGSHCSVSHVTRQSGAGVQPGKQTPDKLLERYRTMTAVY